ncbi:MAG TPA: hypothetical protein VMC10_13190 [Stellaceae bacterium]|nr:hypothetical protein [Stellaceae bacterium]
MEAGLREQLIEAKRNLSRQLEILQSPATVAGKPGLEAPDSRALISELQSQLREINTAISNLGARDA